MSLLGDAVNSALESIGMCLIEIGEWMLEAGYSMWKQSSELAFSYLKQNPMSQGNAWAVVTGAIYNLSLGVAASLTVLFFVMGWLRESIDIRNNFTLENMFRFFVRYAITATLIVNSLALTTGIVECATAVVSTVKLDKNAKKIKGAFDDVKESLEKDDAEGGTWLASGICCMVGGLFGGVVIIVCGVKLVLSVLSRLLKLLLCIPFAPVAFAGFAGGAEFSQSGIAWIKTFIGYALEAVVIALAIKISFGLFGDVTLFAAGKKQADVVAVILMICNYCMPMITACACVQGAETTVRRCLGLG